MKSATEWANFPYDAAVSGVGTAGAFVVAYLIFRATRRRDERLERQRARRQRLNAVLVKVAALASQIHDEEPFGDDRRDVLVLQEYVRTTKERGDDIFNLGIRVHAQDAHGFIRELAWVIAGFRDRTTSAIGVAVRDGRLTLNGRESSIVEDAFGGLSKTLFTVPVALDRWDDGKKLELTNKPRWFRDDVNLHAAETDKP